jgi:hypothetical protein
MDWLSVILGVVAALILLRVVGLIERIVIALERISGDIIDYDKAPLIRVKAPLFRLGRCTPRKFSRDKRAIGKEIEFL